MTYFKHFYTFLKLILLTQEKPNILKIILQIKVILKKKKNHFVDD